MSQPSSTLLRALFGSMRDLLPVLAVIIVFQYLVIGQPLPELARFVEGMILVVIGLTLFVYGLEQGLFPLGESMAAAFAQRGSVPLLLAFAFLLGFSTTVAEPALIAVTAEAAAMAVNEGLISDSEAARQSYSLTLRIVVALAVGCALIIGTLRILFGWPLHFLIIGGYALVMLLTTLAPEEIVGFAYDSGGVTTSTITVPLVTALGVGLASSIRGRNPAVDGFGMIALASLTPMLFVMLYAIVTQGAG